MSAGFELPEFNEPVELQEWYDIGADIRIKIRTQFSQLRRQSQAQLDELREALSKDNLLEIIEEWQMIWRNQNINPEDTLRYRRRALSVDANMRHALAKMISKRILEPDNGK